MKLSKPERRMGKARVFPQQWLVSIKCWSGRTGYVLPLHKKVGRQTSILRQQSGLTKDKTDKSAQKPETHAVNGIALAASHFMSFKKFRTANTRGHHWVGQVAVTSAPFRVISRPNLFRRWLHFENPEKGNVRKRKGGTITPFGFRSGNKVRAEKVGVIYVSWIGGYTQTQKTKNVSVYDHNWRRIGQFSPNKVALLRRSTKLCVVA